MEKEIIKGEKVKLKKILIITWAIIIFVFLLNLVLTIVDFNKYKEGQEFAIATVRLATDEFEEYANNEEEMVEEMYDFYNPHYFSYTSPYTGQTIDNRDAMRAADRADEALAKLMNAAGYECYDGSEYFEYYSFGDYYLYKNTYTPFLVIYGIIFGLVTLTTIALLLDKKRNIIVKKDTVTITKLFKKKADLLIADINSVETTKLKGVKIIGNGFKYSILLLSNNEEVKDNLFKLLGTAKKEIKETKEKKENISAADEIKKYKDLLDAGAITQEEFDKKKKELL